MLNREFLKGVILFLHLSIQISTFLGKSLGKLLKLYNFDQYLSYFITSFVKISFIFRYLTKLVLKTIKNKVSLNETF